MGDLMDWAVSLVEGIRSAKFKIRAVDDEVARSSARFSRWISYRHRANCRLRP